MNAKRPSLTAASNRRDRSATAPRGVVPQTSPVMLSWFSWYAQRYVARHFHSLQLARPQRLQIEEKVPVVVYLNHASWWDPLVCIVLKQALFPSRSAFAPMDAAALNRYAFFRKLGMFGVTPGTTRGAAQFLRVATAVLAQPNSMLWLTPQGRFADARERPVCFQTGLAHLASRVQRVVFLPLAIEYVFWSERLPEILLQFGDPIQVEPGFDGPAAASEWNQLFEQKLLETQDALAARALRRNPAEFVNLLRGRRGVGGVYDLWRRAKARVTGTPFQPDHDLQPHTPPL